MHRSPVRLRSIISYFGSTGSFLFHSTNIIQPGWKGQSQVFSQVVSDQQRNHEGLYRDSAGCHARICLSGGRAEQRYGFTDMQFDIGTIIAAMHDRGSWGSGNEWDLGFQEELSVCFCLHS